MSRLLIVAGKATLRNGLVNAFAHTGFDLLIAGSGTEGLQLAQARQPDVIVIDSTLPDMDGYEVCAMLKANPATTHGLVILLASGPASETAHNARVCGADHLVTKPFHPAELLDLVHHRPNPHEPVASRTRKLQSACRT